jgi:peptide/nickel transport system permease protein
MSRYRHLHDLIYFARQNRLAVVGTAIVLLMMILMLVGPILSPYPPEKTLQGLSLAPPTWSHPFGTDEVGADVLSRVLAAPRTDVLIAIIATACAFGLGVPLGALAGFYGGSDTRGPLSWLSQLIMRVMDIFQAFPIFVLAMVLVTVRGTGIVNVIAAIAIVNAPVFVRLVRSEMLRLRKLSFVEASRCCGTPELKIAFVELLPNTMGPALTVASVTMGFAIILTAGLSFVGAGVREPTPEWGLMISRGAQNMISGYWWTVLAPGTFLGLTVFGFATLGEGVKRFLDPTWRGTEG